MKSLWTIGILLWALNAEAGPYKMENLRNAMKAERPEVAFTFVAGAMEMWMATFLFRGNEGSKIRASATKCASEFSARSFTLYLVDQPDKYPNELPVAVAIAERMEGCLRKELAE